ncbi:MAG: alpha-2-macroglobulin family protein, partial [Pricia sp.]
DTDRGQSETSATENESDQKEEGVSFDEVPIRKNLQETAFFFPQMTTDKEGNVSFNFTTPEALTRWKLQLLGHTKNLESRVATMEAITQKELMVIPNAPRFLREGDEITISSKIANLTDKTLSGQAILEFTDAVSGEKISEKLMKDYTREGQKFKVDSLNNSEVSWRLQIPKGLQAVQYKVIAKAGDFSDGEQNLLPVLTNRKLVTETLPMWVRSDETQTFTLDKLKDNTSPTLRNHQLTLEITSNPAWYAVQALPYLMEYPYECNEQTFARYYANSLASHIANSNPRIREVFDQWANSDALISNLEKNEELKSILIQETPWLRDAKTETEQKKRIALLFNRDKMKNEQVSALNKLRNNQKSSGAWAWFTGGPDNRFITQHIVTGLGHLNHLSVTPVLATSSENSSSNAPGKNPSAALNSGSAQNPNDPTGSIVQNAIAYLDAEFVKEYEEMKKYASDLDENHLSPVQIHYLYMRSFFPDAKTSQEVDKITSYYQEQARKYWTETGLYSKGMLALAMHRADDSSTAKKILQSLKENSITSDELGMYWKENTSSWHWNQAPIETQALMIEAFDEIYLADDPGTGNRQNGDRYDGHQDNKKTIDNLKIWLLKNKQTNRWDTTKATTEAVYALLLQGSDWLSLTDAVDVLIGGEKIEPLKSDNPAQEDVNLEGGSTKENSNIEAGTGYYKTSWDANEIRPEMAEVQLTKKGNGIAWGALYWQYFENLDKITSAETPLKLKKKLFLKKNTKTGEEISEITSETKLKVGDLVRVRIELRSDRAMEFLHMKDMRAAGFEPINVLSSYKWQDGLGYYESTKDASTNFFFDYLPKGVYVFEYDLRVNNAGEFSNGITTIQSMYAPEFTSHSEGVRVNVGDSQN